MILYHFRILNHLKKKETIELEGKNILLFGNNGSGKSSIYFALHVFLQSTLPNKDYNKYFIPLNDPQGKESLLNYYADPNLPYLIELSIKKEDNTIEKYQLKQSTDAGAFPSTHDDISIADFASDFISHRLLVSYYNFRNSQDANIWPLFEKEVFPYWRDAARQNF